MPLHLRDLLERWSLPPTAGVNGLSLLQPHASLFALGQRVVESRSWPTRYRGPVVIAASARWERDEYEAACQERDLLAVWARHGVMPNALPLGAMLAVGRLVGCETGEAIEAAFDARPAGGRAIVAGVTCAPAEHHFGSYGSGRFGFVFADLHRIVVPIPCKGRQGFWAVVGDARSWLDRASLVPVEQRA